jgi:TolB-like protein
MSQDEFGTIRTLTAYRKAIGGLIHQYRGRLVDSPGDNLLAEFASVVDAVNCAVEIQRELAERNAELPYGRQMQFRIGVNLGDVVEEEGRIYGDGVNIAARVESLAEAGGICISGTAYDHVEHKLGLEYEYLGEQEVKNIEKPVQVYRVLSVPGAAAYRVVKAKGVLQRKWRKAALAIAAVLVIVIAAAVVWRTSSFRDRSAEQASEQGTEADPILALPTGPVIAVLPFDNLSGDPERDYFVDGITEEIIAELTRFPELFVLARTTTFQFREMAVDVRVIGRDLGARYVVEGSVRTDSETIRVTAQMIDVETGSHLWAETYERDLSAQNIFAVQDDITQRIVGALGGKHGVIARVTEQREHETRTENLAAYECLLRALVYHYVHNEEQHAIARDSLERAVELDPDYVDVLGELAYVYVEEYRHDWNVRPNSVERGMEVARRALDLDHTHPAAHWAMALCYFSQQKLEEFYMHTERAIAANPNDSHLLTFAAHFMTPTGKWKRGLALMSKSMALNPAHLWFCHFTFFYDHYRKGEYDQALARVQQVTQRKFYLTTMALTAVLGQLGRMDDARTAYAALCDSIPGFTIETGRYEYGVKRNFEPAFLEQMLDGLRKAGVPEK